LDHFELLLSVTEFVFQLGILFSQQVLALLGREHLSLVAVQLVAEFLKFSLFLFVGSNDRLAVGIFQLRKVDARH
jgi:hypothetical protein